MIFAIISIEDIKMLTALVPILMFIVGTIFYLDVTNRKIAELGKWCAIAGMMAFAFANATKLTGF
jgi:hypothetical protein